METQTKQKDEISIEEKKGFGNFKVKYKTKFDRKKEDYIILEIEYSNELHELVKKSISENVKDLVNIERNNTEKQLKRFRIKHWIFDSLFKSKEYLFEKSLVETGQTSIAFTDLDSIEKRISEINSNIKRLIEIMLKSERIDTTVNFIIN